jgi:hypothetical protein
MDGLVRETFFETLQKLLEEWNAGNHSREFGLDLMFHCWYLQTEPTFLTGYGLVQQEDADVAKIFNEVHDWFALEIRNDPEMLFAIAVMGEITPWALGDETVWIARSLEYRNLYALLEPNGLDPEVFEGRGEYGKYFAHQIRVARIHPHVWRLNQP